MSDFEKISIKETVIVEGKYDKIHLQNFIRSPIITLNGFRVFNSKETQSLIRSIANTRGILIMTDVDSAGFILRNFLSGIVPKDCIKHCYVPTVLGKEKRKEKPSKEGILGVEGIDRDELVNAILKSGATVNDVTGTNNTRQITKLDFYEAGLTGRDDSAKLRKALLKHINLPQYLSTNAMIDALNCLFTYDEFNIMLNNFINMEVHYES